MVELGDLSISGTGNYHSIFVHQSDVIERKYHNLCILMLIQRGTGVIRLNENTISVCSSTLLCLSHTDQVRTLFSSDLSVLQIYFDPRIFQPVSSPPDELANDWQLLLNTQVVFELLPFYGNSLLDKTPLFSQPEQFEQALDCACLCQETLNQGSSKQHLNAKAHLSNLLYSVDKTYYQFNNHLNLAKIHLLYAHVNLPEILVQLNRSLNTTLSLCAVCSKFGTNRTDLERLFKQYLGKTFHQYITAQRLDRARAMLHVSNLTINDVAHRTGFSTPQNFCRFFSKKMGISPSKYRKSVLFT